MSNLTQTRGSGSLRVAQGELIGCWFNCIVFGARNVATTTSWFGVDMSSLAKAGRVKSELGPPLAYNSLAHSSKHPLPRLSSSPPSSPPSSTISLLALGERSFSIVSIDGDCDHEALTPTSLFS